MGYKITYKPYGERSILMEWPAKIDENILVDILCFKKKIEKSSIKSIVKVKSSYNSLLISYDLFMIDFENEKSTISKIYSSENEVEKLEFKKWTIPVCYDEVFGIDLGLLSEEKSKSKSEIIQLHCEAIYTVYFIGFLPGFLYLGGLNEALYAPRKSTPRLQIKKGAVAIGGSQTGIYPSASPGGWNVIGNSPVTFFDAKQDPPCFVEPGDKIQFKPVSLQEYETIKTLVDAGVYQLENEVYYG